MATQDLKARLNEITVTQLEIIHVIDCYPVEELTSFVLDLDPSTVWDWIRHVVAPFEKLKTLINNFIIRPPPGADKTEIDRLINVKQRMKEKVHEHCSSLKNQGCKKSLNNKRS